MSLNIPFLLSLFFFYLRKCLSRRTEACNKVHSLIYNWWNRIFSVSFFFFLSTYNFPICRKGRKKTDKIELIFDGFQCSDFFLSFYGRGTTRSRLKISRSFYADFCLKTLFYFFYRRLSPRVSWKSACLSTLTSVQNWRFFFKFL